MILEIVGAIVGGGTLFVSIGYIVYRTGQMSQKLNSIDELLHDGFTCKHHAEIEKEIGRLEGKIEVK